MCDQSVYLKKNNEEVLVMEAAQSIEVVEAVFGSAIFSARKRLLQDPLSAGPITRWCSMPPNNPSFIVQYDHFSCR